MFSIMNNTGLSWERKAQWILVVGWLAVFSGLMVMDINHSVDPKKHTPWGCAAAFLFALAHGMWISLDCRITNRPVGAWRFGAFFLGPLIIWIYLVAAYRTRALWMIPLSCLIYLIPVLLLMFDLLLRTGPPIIG